MRFGYARVSTTEQKNPDSQLDALRGVGCERVFLDKAAGRRVAAFPKAIVAHNPA